MKPSPGPYTFRIGDTRGLGQYKRGGWFHQVKMPKLLDFVRLVRDQGRSVLPQD